MAINAPIVIPDPVGNLLRSYQVADASARDYARLQLEQQRMVEASVQRARENKAQDFKLMLAAVGRQDDLAQKEIENEFRRDQLGVNMFTARTARMNADAMAGYRQEQLGLRGFTADTARMNAENMADFRQEQLDISRMNAEGLSAYRQRRIGAGGSNGDPLGLAAGAGGAGVPAETTPNVPPGDIEDAPTAPPALRSMDGFRRDWAPPEPTGVTDGPGAPGAELFPMGAVPEGTFLPDAPAGGGDSLVGEPLDPAMQAPAVGEYGENGVSGIAAPAASGPPSISAPTPASTEEAALLPPPRFQTPSFAGVDLTQDTRNTLYDLYRANTALTTRSKQSAQFAARIVSDMPKVSPQNIHIYQERYNREMRASQTDAIAANEAKVRAERLKTQATVIEARQAEIASLSNLDGVLPEEDRAQLVADASSLQAGGRADQKIKVLKAYNQVRQAQGLTHPSNGIKTAEQVARRGLALETSDAQKYKNDAALAEKYKDRLANLGPVPEDDAEKRAYTSEKNKMENKLMELEISQELWKDLQSKFKVAVTADTQKEPGWDIPEEKDGQDILRRHIASGAKAPPVPTPVAPTTGQGFIQKTPAPPVKGDGGKFWSEGKAQAAALSFMDGGTDAQGNVIQAMNEEELQAIADGKAPVLANQIPLGGGGGGGGGVTTSGLQHGPKYSETIAKRITPAFKAPVGDEASRGRSGDVSVEDFLREAAKDRLTRLKAAQSAVNRLSAEEKKQMEDIRKKYNLSQ